MNEEERAAEIERLKQMLTASERAGPGYARRIDAIKGKIKDLEA